jgi:hypothetical protein
VTGVELPADRIGKEWLYLPALLLLALVYGLQRMRRESLPAPTAIVTG